MYHCKYCGEPYSTVQAVVCVKCGAPKGIMILAGSIKTDGSGIPLKD